MADKAESEAEVVASADARVVTDAPLEMGFDTGGPAAAYRAARALAGGRAAAGAPPPLSRIGTRAVLALQRTIGNRTLSRRMLMRFDWDGDGLDDPDEPYLVTAPGPNDAAKQVSEYTRERGACNIVVLDAKSMFAYDTNGAPKGKFDLVVPTKWQAGVFVSGKHPKTGAPTPFLRVYMVKGALAWSWERDSSGPLGALMAKPPQNAAQAPTQEVKQEVKPEAKPEADPKASDKEPPKPKPTYTGSLANIVSDGKKLLEVLTADDTLLVIPKYSGGKKHGKGGGKDGKAGSDTAGLSGKEGGEPPNAPAFPSFLTGNDVQVEGGRGTFTMELVYGSNSISNTLTAMNYVTYTWERWELSNATKDSTEAMLQGAAIAAKKKDEAHESGDLDAAGRRWADSYREEKERMAALWHRKRGAGQSYISALKDHLSDDVALSLAPFSWLVGVGGNLLDTIVDVRPQFRVEKEMPFPDKEGLFLVRCIAQPEAVVDGKTPEGGDNIVRRAPSISTMLVETKDARAIAGEAVDKAEADLAMADANLALAQAQGASPEDIAQLRKDRERLNLAAHGSSQELLFEALGAKNNEIDKCDKADIYKLHQLEEERDSLKEQLELTGKRLNEVDPTGKAKPIRLPASFVSKVTGQPYPLLVDLIEYPDSTQGRYHFRLSDVTSKDAAANPDATGATRREAIINVLDLYTQRSGLGAGTLAVRLSAELLGDMKPGDPPLVYRHATLDIGWTAAKKRLADLALILSIIAIFVLGPAGALAGRLLMVAGIAGGAAAAISLADRWDSSTLRWDSATINDIIAVIGALAPGVTGLGRLRVLRLGEEFRILAVEQGDMAAAQAALDSLSATKKGLELFEMANHALGYTGVFLAGKDTIEEILKINRLEREGSITHNEARRQAASALAGALTQLGLHFFGQAKGGGTEEAIKKGQEAETRKTAEAEGKKANEAKDVQDARKSVQELERLKAGLERSVEELKRLKGDEEQLKRRQEELRQKDEELLKKFDELHKLEEAQKAGDAGKPPPAKPPPPVEGPPSSGPKKPSKAQVSESFKRALSSGGDAHEPALDLIRGVGDWKTAIKDLIGGFPKEARARAEKALVEVRDQIVDRAWEKVKAADPRLKDLFRMNVGTKAFSSDIDITVRPTEEALRAAGKDVGELVKLCSEAAVKFKEALRSEVAGQETDRAIDTNVYSFIGEGILVPETPGERAGRADFDRITGLAEALRGGGKKQFAELLKQIQAKLIGQPEAIRHLNELALKATEFAEARGTEERAARDEVRKAHGTQAPEVEQRMVRDRIVDEKKAKLAEAAAKKPPDIAEIIRLQSEILWFEPDAYATRAAIEQAVTQAQSLKAAGQSVTPDEDLAAAKKAFDAAKRSGAKVDVESARDWLEKATADRDAILAEQAKLQALEHEKVGDDPAAQSAHEQKIRDQLRALDAANNRFRSRVVAGAVADIQAGLDSRGYTPGEQRGLGSAAAASNLGLMMDHISHTTDAGSRVKYVCKYGGRVLLALVQGGVKASGSIAAEAMLAMFTRSRWTFNEGEPARAMMRDMLIRYANATGREVNTENGRAVGVPSETQEQFVKEMTAWLQGAAAQLWMTGLTEESAKGGIAEELREVQQAREEEAGAASLSDPNLAEALRKRDTAVRERLTTRLEGELSQPMQSSEGQYQPSTSTAPADMPPTYKDGMRALEGRTDDNAVALRDRLMPIVARALRSPRYFAQVLADAAILARTRGIGINEALVEMARKTGLPVRAITKIEGGYAGHAFYTQVASKPSYFVDEDIYAEHGHMTHLLQDLAVDRALSDAGISERSPQVRGRFGRLSGQAGNLPIGDALWRGTYDNEASKDFGTPEMLKTLLAKYGLR